MNKLEIYEYLTSKGIPFDIVDHPAVYNMAEVLEADLPEPETWAKNLFLRDKKKQHYYLLTLRDEKRADLKAFAAYVGATQVRFASENDLKKYLNLTAGSVSLLGILNDETQKVHVYIDSYFEGRRISVHPNDNTASIYLNCDALVALLKEHGNPVAYIDTDW